MSLSDSRSLSRVAWRRVYASWPALGARAVLGGVVLAWGLHGWLDRTFAVRSQGALWALVAPVGLAWAVAVCAWGGFWRRQRALDAR